MHEGLQIEVLNTTVFDESSDLSTAYVGRTDMTRATKIKAEEIYYIRTRIYDRKIVGWHRMSDTVRHRSKQIIYVKVILLNM